MMFTINWRLTLVTLITMPFLAVVALRFESKIHPAFQEMRLALSSLTTAVQENVTGVRTVKSFAREAYEVEKFSHRNERYKDNQIFAAELWSKFFPVMELLASVSVAILLGVGGTLVINKHMSLGELVAFFSLIWYIIGPVWGLGFQINNYTQSKASGERVLQVLNQQIDVKDTENASVLVPSDVKGEVDFDHVTFAYGNKMPAVKDIHFHAEPGAVIGFLGEPAPGNQPLPN